MDYRNLLMHSSFISLNGFVLSSEERAALHSSLVLLKNENHFYHVVFWGKILGIKNDYHIAQGYHGSILGERKTFYSEDGGVSWKQLQNVQPELYPYIEKIRGLFVGDAAHNYVFDEMPEFKLSKDVDVKQPAPVAENTEPKPADGNEHPEDGDEHPVDPEADVHNDEEPKQPAVQQIPKVRVLEEHRLSYTIHCVDEDTSVAPRGAYVLKSTNEVALNDTFQGLKMKEAQKLNYYLHMRDPKLIPLKTMLQKEHLSKSLDFADTIEEDIPNKCWSLQYEEMYGSVVGRSLLWPGYVFYHVPNSRTWGSYYIGYGEKNLDLCFMI